MKTVFLKVFIILSLIYAGPVSANEVRDASKAEAYEMIEAAKTKDSWTVEELREGLDELTTKLNELETNLSVAEYDYSQRAAIKVRRYVGYGAIATIVAFCVIEARTKNGDGGGIAASFAVAIIAGTILAINQGVLHLNKAEVRQLKRTVKRLKRTISSLQSKLQEQGETVSEILSSPDFPKHLDDLEEEIRLL